MYCSKCGTQNADGSQFCNKCGAAIGKPTSETSNDAIKVQIEDTRHSEKVGYTLFGIGVLIVVVGLCILLYLYNTTAMPVSIVIVVLGMVFALFGNLDVHRSKVKREELTKLLK